MSAEIKKVGRAAATGLQIVGATYPIWQGVLDHAQSDPQNIPAGIIYRATGFDITNGQENWAQVGGTFAVVVGTYISGRLLKRFLR